MSEGLQNSIVVVAGQKGHGKSTFLRKTFNTEPALALIDTLGEHIDWCPRCPENSLAKQVEWLASPPEKFHASFAISPRFKDEFGDNLHFNKLCQAIYMAGDMSVIIEEADRWYPNAGGANWSNPSAGALVEYGRHRQIDLTLVTRNLTIMDRKLTSQVDLFVLFRQQEPRYLEAMEDRFTEEIVDIVMSLPKFEYLVVDRDRNYEQRRIEL